MALVKILLNGYSTRENGHRLISSSTTLIQTYNLNIIVDPGVERKNLLNALAKENLATSEINYVILTHRHLDHCLLAGIFENAKILDYDSQYTNDGKIFFHKGKIPGTDIKIILTPGHDHYDCSVLVNTKDNGMVAIVGDVFRWSDDDEQKIDKETLLSLEDPYGKDIKTLQKSREKILEIADYIIPGHGKPFRFVRKH